jgi:hypothetical protein
LSASSQVFGGIVGLTISVQETNLVLSWPSTGAENYLIQYRSALDTNTTWSTLTNNFPAAVGTNRTAFFVYGAVPLPPSPGTNGGGGGGFPPPAPNAAMMAEPYESDGMETPLEEKTVQHLATRRVFPPYVWDRQHRPPMPWELEARPPFPWEAPAWHAARAQQNSSTGESLPATATTETVQTTTETETGFFRVFHIPNWPSGLQNAVVEGPAFIGLDYADYADRVLSSQVLLNGQPTDFASRNRRTFGEDTYDGLDCFFDRMTNGNYQLGLVTTIRLDDTINEFAPTLTLTSRTVSVIVSNTVFFINWEDAIIGTSTTFEAVSVRTNVDWTIDVYDVVDDFVISQSGHSADGRISWTWDLLDVNGMPRDDWEYDPFFQPFITISGVGFAAAAAKPTPKKALDYPAEGTWLIVFQDRDKRPQARSDYITAMNQLVGGPNYWNIFCDVRMLEYGKEIHTNAAQAQLMRNNSWIDFRAALTSTSMRNFYYQGHGSPNSIGGDYDVLGATNQITGSTVAGPDSKAWLSPEWIRNNITFNENRGARYERFVWLDGCETSKGEWPEAFGIPKSTNTLAYYADPNRQPHTRPSAFVGWDKIVGGNPEWGTTASYKYFRSEWMFQWSFEYTDLDEAFDLARSNSNWITQALMDSALRIYGYNKLGFQDFNRRIQWNGP